MPSETGARTGVVGDRLARPLRAFVLLTYGISLLLWSPVLTGAVGGAAYVALFTAGGFGPTIAAAVVVLWSRGSLRAWLRPLLRWRVPVRYWVYALVVPVVLFGSLNVVFAALGEPVHLERLGAGATAWLLWFLFATPLSAFQEELGWRGFALDRLQGRYSPLMATVLLGVMAGIWELPFNGPGSLVPAVLPFFLTWLWNRTGSVLLCAAFHGAFAAMQRSLVLVDLQAPLALSALVGMLVVGATVVTLATRGRFGFDRRAEPATVQGAEIGDGRPSGGDRSEQP